jgi:hypothetical protein
LASARDLDSARDLIKKLLGDLDSSLKRPLVRDPTLVRDRVCALNLAHTLASNLAFILNSAFTLPHDPGFASKIDRNLARARYDTCNGVFTRGLALALDRDITLTIALDFDSDLALAFTRDLAQNIAPVLSDLLGISANKAVKMRQVTRKYVAELLKIAHTRRQKMEKSGLRFRWGQPHREAEPTEKEKQEVLHTYWWLQIMMAREEGRLPAWEGIRIVGEQVPAK